MKHSKNIEKIQNIIASYNIECWLLYSEENCDPYFDKYISNKLSAFCLCLVTKSQCFVIANSLDFDNLESFENISNVKYSSRNGEALDEILLKVMRDLNFPSTICLTYSTMNDPLVDVLGHGAFITLTNKIDEIYKTNEKEVSFDSAEEIIYALSDRKEDHEIKRLALAARRADEILNESFQQLKPGMTELDVVRIVHKVFEHKPEYFRKSNVVKEDFSWSKELCPVVLAGPSLLKGGHAEASDLIIEKGFTIYFDFGVTLHFSDGSYYSSDIQRMGYFLKDDEEDAPLEIKNLFKTLYDSVSLGIANLIPGKKGYELDDLVRAYIINSGYVDYDHSTGHAVGETTHSPGTLLGKRSNPLSLLEIQPNGVYTIEPRIPIHNGGSIEEMVVANAKGGVPISPRQTSLYLIR